jgi:hypothetical protein
MDEYKKWLKESRYVIIEKSIREDACLSVTKSDICSYASETGYYGIIDPAINLHKFYIDIIKCRYMTKLLKEAYMFDAYNFSRRCRKEKLIKIEECQKFL